MGSRIGGLKFHVGVELRKHIGVDIWRDASPADVTGGAIGSAWPPPKSIRPNIGFPAPLASELVVLDGVAIACRVSWCGAGPI